MTAVARRSSRWLLAALLAAALVGAFLLRDRLDLPALEAAVGGLGAWGALAFAGLFAAGTVLFLPGSVFGLAGGALFGPLWGTVVNLAAGTLGATLAFLVARHLAGDWVARRAGGRLRQVVEGVEAEGWRFVALVRLVPVVPFNLANYALGLTRIPLGQYVLATAIAMLPGTAAYAWLGHAGAARSPAARRRRSATACSASPLWRPSPSCRGWCGASPRHRRLRHSTGPSRRHWRRPWRAARRRS